MSDLLLRSYRMGVLEQVGFETPYVGPEVLEHGVPTLVACYPAAHPDGQAVDLYCTAMPARFYRLRVLANADNSKGDWSLHTGSGQQLMAVQTAKAIADGRLRASRLTERLSLEIRQLEEDLLDHVHTHPNQARLAFCDRLDAIRNAAIASGEGL